MSRSRAPFKWYGGKGNMLAKLLPLVPPHRTYVEPFCGAASMLFAKTVAEVETINDLDGGVAGFFRVLRDQPEEFLRLARLSEYGRELYNECRSKWQNEEDPVRRAGRWWVVASEAFGGRWGANWTPEVNTSNRGMAGACSKLQTRVDEVLPVCVERLRRVQIDNSDALVCIRRQATEDGFCYCDPPYVGETRCAGEVYKHEAMGTDFHAELTALLLETPGAVMLSCYAHAVYDPLAEAGWARHDFATACHAAGRTRKTGIIGAGAALEKQARVETVWLNPECVRRLAYAGHPTLELTEVPA